MARSLLLLLLAAGLAACAASRIEPNLPERSAYASNRGG